MDGGGNTRRYIRDSNDARNASVRITLPAADTVVSRRCRCRRLSRYLRLVTLPAYDRRSGRRSIESTYVITAPVAAMPRHAQHLLAPLRCSYAMYHISARLLRCRHVVRRCRYAEAYVVEDEDSYYIRDVTATTVLRYDNVAGLKALPYVRLHRGIRSYVHASRYHAREVTLVVAAAPPARKIILSISSSCASLPHTAAAVMICSRRQNTPPSPH